jgi:hypothetical protein
MQAGGSFFIAPADPEPDGAAEADAELERAADLAAAGDYEAEARATLRALAWEPFRVGLRERLSDIIARARDAAARPHPLQGTRGFVVLVEAEQLLAGDDLLLAYADAMSGSELLTLAIDASRLEAEVAAQDLHALVERCELGSRDDVDLVAVTGPCDAAQRHRMHADVDAYYMREAVGERSRPVFTPETLGHLRSYAQTALLLGREAADRSLAEEALLRPLLA